MATPPAADLSAREALIQASVEARELARQLESLLGPENRRLVHRLRLAAETVGMARVTASLPASLAPLSLR